MRKTLFLFVILVVFLGGCSTKEFNPYVYQDVEVIDLNETTDPATFIRDVENVGLKIEVKETDLNPAVAGSYQITYKISLGRKSTEKTFTVKVKDYQAPTITVEKEIKVPYGGTFSIKNVASAYDEIDGDVSSSLHYIGEVNLYAEGNYDIQIVAVDQFGNEAKKDVRIVVAKDQSYQSELFGKYTDTSYSDGQAPTVQINEDGTFALYLNSCSVINLIEGKYKQYYNVLYLVADDYGFSYNEEENVVSFVIEIDGTLRFNSKLNLCAPNYGDLFEKNN